MEKNTCSAFKKKMCDLIVHIFCSRTSSREETRSMRHYTQNKEDFFSLLKFRDSNFNFVLYNFYYYRFIRFLVNVVVCCLKIYRGDAQYLHSAESLNNNNNNKKCLRKHNTCLVLFLKYN